MIRTGWRPDVESLERVLSRFPPAASERVEAVRAASKAGRETPADVRERLAKAEPLLAGGDPAKGRAVFFGTKVACSGCHRIGTEGGRVGPDLTRIGAIRSGRDLLESILFPSSTFAKEFDPYILLTEDETVVLASWRMFSPIPSSSRVRAGMKRRFRGLSSSRCGMGCR